MRQANVFMDWKAGTAKQLLLDYGQPDVLDSHSRERNLNRFIQFVGVSYQVVRVPLVLSRLSEAEASQVPTSQLHHEDDVRYKSPTAVRHEHSLRFY